MNGQNAPTEEALQACRERFSRILDKYNVSPDDRKALNDIEVEFFDIKTELLAKLEHVMKALKNAPGAPQSPSVRKAP